MANDPYKMFPALQYTRKGVAEIFDQVTPFKEDDPRLTDELCQKFADLVYDSLLDSSSVDLYEIEYYAAEAIVKEYGLDG